MCLSTSKSMQFLTAGLWYFENHQGLSELGPPEKFTVLDRSICREGKNCCRLEQVQYLSAP